MVAFVREEEAKVRLEKSAMGRVRRVRDDDAIGLAAARPVVRAMRPNVAVSALKDMLVGYVNVQDGISKSI
jgi:hypothetical protein